MIVWLARILGIPKMAKTLTADVLNNLGNCFIFYVFDSRQKAKRTVQQYVTTIICKTSLIVAKNIE